MGALGIMMLRRGTMANPIAGSDYILSEGRGDPEVFRILMEKGVSLDGVGITKDDAARVTGVGTWFQGNADIRSFEEFKYFTGVKSLVANAFNMCGNMTTLILPPSCATLGQQALIDTGINDIDLENVTSLGPYAIARCNIKRFSAPNMTEMGVGNLHRCPNLLVVEDTGKITSLNGGPSFTTTTLFECPALESVTLSEPLKTISGTAVLGECVNLRYLYVSANMESIGSSYFAYINQGSTAVHLDVVMGGANPPTINSNFLLRRTDYTIYVPDASVDAYKSAWSAFAAKIQPLSSYQG